MGAINAFIVRRQSAHKTSPSNATRKAVAISLKATRRPCQWTRQGHCECEGTMSITMILIPQWQLLPQGRQLPQCVQGKHKLQRFDGQRRSQGSYSWRNNGNYCHHQHGQREQNKLHDNDGHRDNKRNNKKSLPVCKDKGFKPWCLHGKYTYHLYDKCHTNPCNQARKQQQQLANSNQTNKTQLPWHVHHVSCTQQLLDKQQSKLPGRASDTVFSDKRTRTSNDNKKIPFC